MRTVLITLALLATPISAGARTLQCRDLPMLVRLFEKHHYQVRSVDRSIMARAADQFVEAIDPSKTLLIASDLPPMKRDLAAILTSRRPRCDAITRALELVIRRAVEDERLARTMLDARYALDEKVELILDPDKRQYAKTSQERASRVRDMIHFQISGYLAAGLELERAKPQLVHRYELTIKSLRRYAAEGAAHGWFANALAAALDPHSTFMSADTLADFRIQMRLSLEGIGAVLRSRDGFTIIKSLVKSGQADKSGMLRPKDKIIAVAQENEDPLSIIDMDLRHVVKLIRGKKGTKVTLTILREAEKNRAFKATIVRDKIDIASLAAKITYATRTVGGRTFKIGILDLPSFYGGGHGGRSSFADVRRLLAAAKAEKVDALVLDLSRNGGGLLQDAVRISGAFIRLGAVVGTQDANGDLEVLADQDSATDYAGPLVVYISRASASASEILAGALKNYHRAVIVGGERTFGKGTVQVVMPLPFELGAITVTTAMFFLPGGKSTQRSGVTADVRVPSVLDAAQFNEASLDYALPGQTIGPFLSGEAVATAGPDRWRPIQDDWIRILNKKSRARVAKDAEFARLATELEMARANAGVIRLADLRRQEAPQPDGPDSADQRASLVEVTLSECVNIAADLAALAPQ